MRKDGPNKALLEASRNGDLEAVKQALKEGADPAMDNDYWSGEYKENPLCVAATNGHLEVVKSLYEHVGQKIEKLFKDDDGDIVNLAFLKAIEEHQNEVARWLADKGGPFLVNHYGTALEEATALETAIKSHNLELLRYLFEKGLTLKEFESASLAMECASEPRIREYLLTRYLADNPESEAKADLLQHFYDDLEYLQWLHGKGFNLAAKTEEGGTVLHKVASQALEGSLKSMVWLCENGAEINVRGREQKTSLSYALSNLYQNWKQKKLSEQAYEKVVWLLQQGAELDDSDIPKIYNAIWFFFGYHLKRDASHSLGEHYERLIGFAIKNFSRFMYPIEGCKLSRAEYITRMKGSIRPENRELLALISERKNLNSFYEDVLSLSLLSGDKIQVTDDTVVNPADLQNSRGLIYSDFREICEERHDYVKTPHARKAMMDFMKEAVCDFAKNNLCYFLTTFSPYFSPDEILELAKKIDIEEVRNPEKAREYNELAAQFYEMGDNWMKLYKEEGRQDMKNNAWSIKVYSFVLFILGHDGPNERAFYLPQIIKQLVGVTPGSALVFDASFSELSDEKKRILITYACRYTGWGKEISTPLASALSLELSQTRAPAKIGSSIAMFCEVKNEEGKRPREEMPEAPKDSEKKSKNDSDEPQQKSGLGN